MSTGKTSNDLAEGDLVLRTQSGTRFRIHSTVLMRASAFFAGLLKDAHPDNTPGPAYTNEIAVEEDDLTVDVLLKVAAGLPFSFVDLKDMDEIERIAHAADKYSIPAVLTILEAFMYAPVVTEHPLRRYALASRYGWAAVRADAEKQLLDIDIDYASVPPMDMLHLARLLRLRQLRLSTLQRIFEDPAGRFSIGNREYCPEGHFLSHPTAWENLKCQVLWEMTRKPSGSTVPVLLQSFTNTDPLCTECVSKGCEQRLWSWLHTCDAILDVIKTLPNSPD